MVLRPEVEPARTKHAGHNANTIEADVAPAFRRTAEKFEMREL
jgi:hypothetical protein